MRFSRVKAKLRRGEPALVVTCHFIDPSVFELTSLLGFDGIWLDLEHHSTSTETASQLMRAARVGVSDVIVRPAKGEFMRIGRILEAGGEGPTVGDTIGCSHPDQDFAQILVREPGIPQRRRPAATTLL